MNTIQTLIVIFGRCYTNEKALLGFLLYFETFLKIVFCNRFGLFYSSLLDSALVGGHVGANARVCVRVCVCVCVCVCAAQRNIPITRKYTFFQLKIDILI
jgi:hypothetical protein